MEEDERAEFGRANTTERNDGQSTQLPGAIGACPSQQPSAAHRTARGDQGLFDDCEWRLRTIDGKWNRGGVVRVETY